MRNKLKFILSALMLCAIFAVPSSAQSSDTSKQEFKYVVPTMENLSRLYWRLDKFPLDDDQAIDNFMRINECSVFKDYYHNEFEWREIRKSSRGYIEKHKETFPTRFEFVQPLSLGEYDFERKGFHVIKDHKIKSVRRFEVYSDNLYGDICGERKHVQGYPRAMVLELSRPLDFDFIPMDEKKAQALINRKIEKFKKLDRRQQNKDNLYDLRDSILVIKAKAFSIKPKDERTPSGYYTAGVLAVLDSVEIYSDRDRDDLIFEEKFRRKKVNSNFEQRLKEKYEASRRKASEKIIDKDTIKKIEEGSKAADEAYNTP